MKKSLWIAGGINAVILLMAFLAGGEGSRREGALVAGLVALALVGLNFLVGIILVIASRQGEPARKNGLSLLLLSGILLLCSFTLCSSGFL